MVYAQHTHSAPSLTYRKHMGKNLLKSENCLYSDGPSPGTTNNRFLRGIGPVCQSRGRWPPVRFPRNRKPAGPKLFAGSVQAAPLASASICACFSNRSPLFSFPALFTHEVIGVLIVLRADELVDLFGGRKIRHALHRECLRQHAGVFDGALNFQMT
jgi:hypothetical protein